MESIVIIPFLYSWFVCIVATAMIGARKGEVVGPLLVAIFFGPLGVVIALCSHGQRVQCPFCKERIWPTAAVCPFCQSGLTKENYGK